AVVAHLDLCLGCRGCESACPAGVRYGRLIEQTRAYLEGRARRPIGQRLKRWVVGQLFPYPRRLALLLWPARLAEVMGVRPWLERHLPGALGEWLSLIPRRQAIVATCASVSADGPAVAIHAGCVTRVVAPATTDNATELLARAGYRADPALFTACCGALDLHSGNRPRALEFARANVRRFVQAGGADHIISTASGCTTAMAEYGELLKDDPDLARPASEFARRVSELSTLLLKATRPLEGSCEATVTYHDACHLAHGMGVRREPRQLLKAVGGVKLVELESSDLCCGSAGSYNLTQPQAAAALGRRKADTIEQSGAQYVVMANPGCQFQIAAELRRRGSSIQVMHLADFLAQAVARREQLARENAR
ncbi:MAG TPA: heterodisulfide reductase-related iron-sulfur binding cluster, partial [Candidatus Binataceae bacterium]|nr:heterodisulfide reductase-related iron-sulfur binding cluster [Candidatus Binataceae bacterium]